MRLRCVVFPLFANLNVVVVMWPSALRLWHAPVSLGQSSASMCCGQGCVRGAVQMSMKKRVIVKSSFNVISNAKRRDPIWSHMRILGSVVILSMIRSRVVRAGGVGWSVWQPVDRLFLFSWGRGWNSLSMACTSALVKMRWSEVLAVVVRRFVMAWMKKSGSGF